MRQKLYNRLLRVYRSEVADELCDKLIELIDKYKSKIVPKQTGWSQADSLLITYADSVCADKKPLAALGEFLNEHVGSLISYVHLLPFFPYSSDDGFAVEDFRSVREDLGGWAEVAALSENYRLVFDGVINHVSS